MPIHARDELTDWERKVADAAVHGAELVCSDRSVGDHSVDGDFLPGVRAEVIRDLLLGRYGELDPRGVRIRGARIIGALDLNHVRATAGLELINCAVPEAITAEWARLPRLVLHGCVLTTMHADGLRVAGELVLEHVRAAGSGKRGTIRLMDARIGGDFDCDDATITNDSGPALTADRIDVGGGLVGRQCRVSGAGEKGALRLPDAHVGGQLNWNDAEIVNNSGPALIAERIRTDGSVWLERLHTKGAGEDGTLRLLGAQVGGQFCIGDAELLNTSGAAVVADGLVVGKDLFLPRSRVHAASEEGAIRLPGAHVGGQLACDRTEITNNSGPALVADGLHVDKGLFLRQLRARGKGERGAIRLVSAQIDDYMTCDGSQIDNEDGPALYADRIQVTGTLAVRLVHAKGTGALGTIRLLNARIDGQFDCDGANVENASGYTFTLQGACVSGDVLLPTAAVCPDPSLCNSPTQPRLVDLDGFTFRTLGRGTWTQWLHLIRHHTPDYRPQPYQQLAATERSAGHDGNARLILITQQHDLRTRAPDNLGNWFLRRAHWLWGILTGYGYRARRTALALLLALTAAGTVGYIAGHVDTRPGHHAAERAAQPATDRAAAGTPCSTIELLGVGLDRGLPLGPSGLRGRCEVDTTSMWGQGFAALIWVIQAIVWALAVLAFTGYTNLIRKPA